MSAPGIMHLSIAVKDLDRARAFYCGLLGCEETRSVPGQRFDFRFHGHHVVAHLVTDPAAYAGATVNEGGAVFPVCHFGAILPVDEWTRTGERLKAAGVEFIMEPQVRYPGTVREGRVMLMSDTCGNVVEFKGQAAERIFATR